MKLTTAVNPGVNGLQNTKHLANGFYESSLRYPDRLALSIDGKNITYDKLANLSQSLSRILVDIPPSDAPPLTAVFGQRSLLAYAGILAALFAGHGYVPLNPDFPISRLQSMLARSRCRSLIADENALHLLSDLLFSIDTTLTVILPQTEDVTEHQKKHPNHIFQTATVLSEEQYAAPRKLGDIAYLLFTSGSTGTPKGVMVSHENACHFLNSAQQRYSLGPTDRVSQTFALTFDLSVFDLFLAWGAGACVCVPRAIELIKPGGYINREQITCWFSVPSTALFMKKFGELKANKYPTLKWSLFCGEALSEEIAEHWSLAAPNSVLENLYGPTELTIACTVYRRDKSASKKNGAVVPIGEPLPDMSAIIVDDNLQEVPVGSPGELMLTGPQLTLGYLDDLERTNKAYVTPPGFDTTYYRTGDIVIRKSSLLPLEYVGRRDNQIQVNGHRVELGEVECAIRNLANADEAVAIGWPKTATGVGGIVAFVLGDNIDKKQLLHELKLQLPSYMTPNKIVSVSRYPLNSNGKIDRNTLIETLKESPQ